MITLFAIPKPFRGHIGIIQRNAIISWTHLAPRPEIILFGDEEGTAEIAEELGLQYVREVERNEHNTPLVSDIFQKAARLSTQQTLCYLNSDIILFNDFIQAVERVKSQFDRYLMVGQRSNVLIEQPLTFGAGWEDQLRAQAAKEGKLSGPSYIDYFVLLC